MSSFEFRYIYEGKEYKVVVTRKKMRTIRYYYKDGVFKISASTRASQKTIVDGLNKYAGKLIKADVRTHASGDDFIFILGTKIAIRESGEIRFTDGTVITYKNRTDLDKGLRKWFLKVMENRTRYYERMMGVKKPYAIRVKKMNSRFGSNSLRTHSISFQLDLVHFSKPIIDSVIVHELAHHFNRDHSYRFYKVVYTYCPDYWDLKKKLRRRIYK